MMAYSMLIPAVFLGTQGLDGKPATEIMQYYLTCTQLFVSLGSACKNLVLSYKRVQELSGHSTRVWELLKLLQRRGGAKGSLDECETEMKAMAVQQHQEAHKEDKTEFRPPVILRGDVICFENVDIYSPTGKLLIKGLNLTVSKNTNVLISGPNGSGKSSLFRVLGGLWPLCSGSMTRPDNTQVFYIPQKPYMSPGTLRDQVTYPLTFRSTIHDTKLNELMSMVGLSSLVTREGWDTEKDWADVLSGGEKQRVAMARLFFHRPAFGILDECTSAVSMDVEAGIYETCKNLGITIFTVSHRPQLMHHHDYMLKLDGQGGWEWITLQHQQ